jgi:GTPase Era involved in 16S rRNA processing
MHVAGSDAMQARLIKYYHGQYADNARAHTRIKAASSKEMEKIVAVLQARLARGEKAFPLGEFTERDMAERMRERAAKEPDKPVPEKKKRWFW